MMIIDSKIWIAIHPTCTFTEPHVHSSTYTPVDQGAGVTGAHKCPLSVTSIPRWEWLRARSLRTWWACSRGNPWSSTVEAPAETGVNRRLPPLASSTSGRAPPSTPALWRWTCSLSTHRLTFELQWLPHVNASQHVSLRLRPLHPIWTPTTSLCWSHQKLCLSGGAWAPVTKRWQPPSMWWASWVAAPPKCQRARSLVSVLKMRWCRKNISARNIIVIQSLIWQW